MANIEWTAFMDKMPPQLPGVVIALTAIGLFAFFGSGDGGLGGDSDSDGDCGGDGGGD